MGTASCWDHGRGRLGQVLPHQHNALQGPHEKASQARFGKPSSSVPSGELVHAAFACLVWRGFVCLWLVFFCLTPPLRGTNSFLHRNNRKRANRVVTYHTESGVCSCLGSAVGQRQELRSPGLMPRHVCDHGSPEEMQGGEGASEVSE